MADVFDVAQKAQSGIEQATTSGIDQGVKLAQMSNEQEKHGQALKAQKEELDKKKFDNSMGMMTTLAKSNPKISKMMVPKLKEKFMQMGVPVDDAVLEMLSSDEEYKKRFLKFSNLANEKAVRENPNAVAEGLMAAQDFGEFDKGIGLFEHAASRGFTAEENVKQREHDEKIADKRLKATEGKEDRRQTNKDVDQLSKELTSVGETVATIDELDSLIDGGLYGKGDEVKGFKGLQAAVADSGSWFGADWAEADLPDDARQLRAVVQKLMNVQLKDRSGASVTVQELENLKKEFSRGMYKNAKDFKVGLQRAVNGIKSKMKQIEAGASPDAMQVFEGRGGRTTRSMPGQDSAQKQIAGGPKAPPAVDPAEADAIAAKKFDTKKIEAYKKARGL